jgi:branched-chain amino acid transport system permease protein
VGRISLGHGAFFGIGALVTRQLWLGGIGALQGDVLLLVAMLAGGVAAALAAMVLGTPALQVHGIYFAVGTLALGEALRLTVSLSMQTVSRLPGPMLRSYEYVSRYNLSLAVLTLTIVTVIWLKQSKLGMGMIAVREDPEAASSIVINVFLHSLIAFVMSAFFAGLTGGLIDIWRQLIKLMAARRTDSDPFSEPVTW